MTGPLGLFVVGAVAIFAGVADAKPPQKIVGGTVAAAGEFPYMVSLRLHGSHQCGGAIVGPRHVVTAAHCVVGVVTRPYTNFRIATGTLSSSGGKLHAVSKVTPHPRYNVRSANSANDIAVIELAAPLTFNRNENKVDLPTTVTPGGVTATATGWGYKSAAARSGSWELMKVNLQTLEPTRCNSQFRGTDAAGKVQHDHVCTFSGHGLGTCPGDSGGPLVWNGKLVGVVSYGIPCAIGYPDVYTSVYHFADWIRKTMQS